MSGTSFWFSALACLRASLAKGQERETEMPTNKQQPGVPEKYQLIAIKLAIRELHEDLDNRKDGDRAAFMAIDFIEWVLGLRWEAPGSTNSKE